MEPHLTQLSAKERMSYACTVKQRLPQTFAALAAGRIHPVHVMIIEDETRFLSDADAATADAVLTPGWADGFGALDGDDARDLAAAAARHPAPGGASPP